MLSRKMRRVEEIRLKEIIAKAAEIINEEDRISMSHSYSSTSATFTTGNSSYLNHSWSSAGCSSNY